MKILISLFLIYFNLSPLFSQLNPKLNTYYQSLYTAEDFILTNQFDSSIYYYEKAFAMFPENFVTDLNNALICAIEADRYELTGKYIVELLKQGVPRSYFEKKHYFSRFVDSQIFDAMYEPFDTKIDSFKIKLIDSMLVTDQYPRVNNMPDSAILAIDMINEKILEDKIFTDGLLPKSYEVGVQIYGDTILVTPNLHILMIHQVRDDLEKYGKFYINNLEHHNINPLTYFSQAQTFGERSDTTNLGCEGRIFAVIESFGEDAFTCCCNLKDQVNKNRAKYYLEDLDRAIKKYRFSKTTKLPFMLQKHVYGKWEFPDDKKLEDAINKRLSDPNYVRFLEE
ncbi:MAG: hypothetical protein IPP89_15605 [Saprospiraceae bacterium]|nr:hypothetical protein [Candidatus Brachybacter algidus]MBL0120363.1 hypothetical protein [Candidatus Brachybacter algidus]